MTWERWQHICGWAALGAGAAWGIKFLILIASGRPGAAQPLTGFLLPTLGSVLGLVGCFGIAAPMVKGRAMALAVAFTIIVGVAAVLLSSIGANAVLDWSVVAASDNAVVRTESSALASSAIFLLIGAWLLSLARRAGASRTSAAAPERT